LLGALALAAVLPPSGLADFPGEFFPVAAVNRNLDRLTSSPALRTLTSDQWADYLIYRLYPRIRVFYDGRSDFYGDAVGDDYQSLLAGGPRYREVMERYGFTTALLPLDWPLVRILERDPEWTVVDRDKLGVLLTRRHTAAPGSGRDPEWTVVDRDKQAVLPARRHTGSTAELAAPTPGSGKCEPVGWPAGHPLGRPAATVGSVPPLRQRPVRLGAGRRRLPS
jgi:hypothetical protein